jgi:CubicO group peptidase (beta-lactamase class C family)
MFRMPVVLGVVALVLPSAASAQIPEPIVAARVRALADSMGVPGGAVVIRANGVESIVTIGTRNSSDAVTAETVFRIASVSKVFTAAAAARLAADGRLSLTADIRTERQWLERLAPGAEPVTMAGLLTHTAGFDDRIVGMFARSVTEVTSLAEYVQTAMPRRTSAPGREVRYSNHGAALAGLVVAQAVGAPFDEAVATLVLHPLGMTSTSFAQPLPPDLLARLAIAYDCSDTGCAPLPLDYRHAPPAGGLVTTPADMRRFMRGILDGGEGTIGQEAVRLLTTGTWSAHPDVPGMALALQEQDIAGYRGLVHAGRSSGYTSLLAIVPEASAGLFVVTTGGSSRFGAAVLDEFAEGLGIPDAEAASMPGPIAADDLEEYRGTYLLGRAARGSYESFPGHFLFQHTIGADDDGYLTRWESGERRRYGRVAGDRFASVDGVGTMVFERNGSGRIDAVHAAETFNGARFPATYRRLRGVMVPSVLNEVMSWAIGLPIIAAMVWVLSAVVTMWRRRARPMRSGLAWVGVSLSAAAVGVTCFFGFGFLARFNAIAMRDPVQLAYGLPENLATLLWLPWAIGACTVLLLMVGIASWRRRSEVRRIDRLLITVTGICQTVFVAMLIHFSFLPPHG